MQWTYVIHYCFKPSQITSIFLNSNNVLLCMCTEIALACIMIDAKRYENQCENDSNRTHSGCYCCCQWMWWRSHASSKLYGCLLFMCQCYFVRLRHFIAFAARDDVIMQCWKWNCSNYGKCQCNILVFSCKRCDARDVRRSISLFLVIQLCGWFRRFFICIKTNIISWSQAKILLTPLSCAAIKCDRIMIEANE